MRSIFKAGLGFAMVLAMTAPSLAQSIDPTGLWQPDKNSDYEMSLCGKDNTELCIKVVALRNKMDSAKNRPYLNTFLIDKAKVNGKNRWKGKLSLFGQTGDATMTFTDQNTMYAKVCAYLIICDDLTMTRVK